MWLEQWELFGQSLPIFVESREIDTLLAKYHIPMENTAYQHSHWCSLGLWSMTHFIFIDFDSNCVLGRTLLGSIVLLCYCWCCFVVNFQVCCGIDIVFLSRCVLYCWTPVLLSINWCHGPFLFDHIHNSIECRDHLCCHGHVYAMGCVWSPALAQGL